MLLGQSEVVVHIFLDWSKLKAFADYKMNVTENLAEILFWMSK